MHFASEEVWTLVEARVAMRAWKWNGRKVDDLEGKALGHNLEGNSVLVGVPISSSPKIKRRDDINQTHPRWIR